MTGPCDCPVYYGSGFDRVVPTWHLRARFARGSEGGCEQNGRNLESRHGSYLKAFGEVNYK